MPPPCGVFKLVLWPMMSNVRAFIKVDFYSETLLRLTAVSFLHTEECSRHGWRDDLAPGPDPLRTTMFLLSINTPDLPHLKSHCIILASNAKP
jgi:hypothetical protein